MPSKYNCLSANASRLLNKQAGWLMPTLKSVAKQHLMGSGIFTAMDSLTDDNFSPVKSFTKYLTSPTYLAMNTAAGYGMNLGNRAIGALGKGVSKVPGLRTMGGLMQITDENIPIRRAAVISRALKNSGLPHKPGAFDFMHGDEALFNKYKGLTPQHLETAGREFDAELGKRLTTEGESTLGHLPIVRTMSGRRDVATTEAAKHFGANTFAPYMASGALSPFGLMSIPTMAYPMLTGKDNPLSFGQKLYDEKTYSGLTGGSSKLPAYF